jgi:small-conductance mechanosensitive channel
MQEILLDTLQTIDATFAPADIQIKLLKSALIIIFLWVLRVAVVRIINRQIKAVTARFWWKKVLTYAIVIVGSFLVGSIWVNGLQSVATFLALIAAALAIALQSPITDMAGWIFLIWQRPFEVGDRIEVGQYKGDVIDIRMFQFSLLEIGNWIDADQNTGRIMHLPNKIIFNKVLANYSQEFKYIWNEIPVLVTFESDWEKAKSVLQDIAHNNTPVLDAAAEKQFKDAARHYMITQINLDPVVYTKVEDSGVLLTIRYVCAYNNRRASAQKIWEAILHAFAQDPDLEFAYPTQRLYYDWVERLEQTGHTATHTEG